MAVAWVILWSGKAHGDHELCRSGWRWSGPFSGLSITMRCAVADGDGMHHFGFIYHYEIL